MSSKSTKSKKCSGCKKRKALDNFAKNSSRPDGLQTECRDCFSARYQANRERRDAQNKVWTANHPEKVKAIQKRSKVKHGERAKQSRAQRRAANLEQERAKDAAWKANQFRRNPTKLLAANSAWAKGHPFAIKAKVLRYEARKRNARGTCTGEQLQARVEFWGDRCWVCSGPNEAIDHVIALSQGGTNWPANLRPICTSHNSSKGKRHPGVWRPKPRRSLA